MNKIDEYVDSMYQDFDAEENEVQELKAEMKVHLLESVNELIAEGHSPEKALEIAFERFGDKKMLGVELGETYHLRRIHKTFAKGLLAFSVLLGILGSLWIASFFAWNWTFSDRELVSLKEEILKVMEANASKIEGHTFPKEVKQKIADIVDSRASIHTVGIYNLGPGASGPYDFAYPVRNLNEDGYLKNDERTFIYTHEAQMFGTISEKNTSITFVQWLFTATYLKAGVCLLFGYWVLFAVWGILNIYYNRNFRLGWAALISVFNVLGYWIYLIVNRRKMA